MTEAVFALTQKGGKNDQTDLFVHHPAMQYGNSGVDEKVTRIIRGRKNEIDRCGCI